MDTCCGASAVECRIAAAEYLSCRATREAAGKSTGGAIGACTVVRAGGAVRAGIVEFALSCEGLFQRHSVAL